MSLDPGLIERFVGVVGEKFALRHEEDIDPYVHELRRLFVGSSPLVLRPGSAEEVAAVLRLATETGTPVVPQGGNTGLVGGQTPDGSGSQIVLSLSRLQAIREIDEGAATMTVEAGVTLQAVRDAAAEKGLLFPLSIASQGTAQIGGILATNAGGVNVLAYGNARDLCLGLEVILPTGERLDDLRKLRKDNTGYDLKNLFIGAEGTLGVITAAVLKLVPQPKGLQIGWAAVPTPAAALKLLRTGFRHGRIVTDRVRTDRRRCGAPRREAYSGRACADREPDRLARADGVVVRPQRGRGAGACRSDPRRRS